MSGMPEVQIDRMLEHLLRLNATEVRMVAGLPPRFFRAGRPLPLSGRDLSEVDVDRLMRCITPEPAQAALIEHARVAFSFRLGEFGHFDVELEMIAGMLAMVIRRRGDE